MSSANRMPPNSADPTSPLDLAPVSGRIGAEVRGLRLVEADDAATVAVLEAALVRHKVLFFRDQGLDDASQEAVAARFGPLVATPTLPTAAGSEVLLDLESIEGGAASSWHTDATFAPAYPAISVLRAVEVPEFGGDTLWANAETAYTGLPDPLRMLVDELRALHTNAIAYASAASRDKAAGYRAATAANARLDTWETEHPVVRVHPVSGERSLLTGHFLKQFVGLNLGDSLRLFETLLDHLSAPENTVRWRWRRGDVAIWDNRSTQHRAIADFGSQCRVMRRATVAGDVPIGTDGRPSKGLVAPACA